MSTRKTAQVLAFGALIAASVPAFADHGRSERGYHPRHDRFEYRHAPRRVVVERPVYAERRVVVERPVYVERPAPVYQPYPVYEPYPAYEPPVYGAPVYEPAYPAARGVNPVGAAVGAGIGAVIGSQIGHGHSRGATAAIGAVIGGVIGSQF